MKITNWDFPDDLLYDTRYQWIKKTGNTVLFGLTPYGLDITGDILYLSLPAVGTEITAGSACGSLEAGKWVGRVYAPMSGRVIKINEAVLANPVLISQSPYTYWFAELEIGQLAELDNLMSAGELCDWLAEEQAANA